MTEWIRKLTKQLYRPENLLKTTYTENVWITFFWIAIVLDNCFQVLQPIPDFEDLLELLIIFHNYDVTLGVIGHKMACLSWIGCVDANSKSTGNRTTGCIRVQAYHDYWPKTKFCSKLFNTILALRKHVAKELDFRILENQTKLVLKRRFFFL